MLMVNSISHRQFTEKLALTLIHNNFGVSISPEAQSIGNKAVADLPPRSTHQFMPLTTLEQYQSKQGCAGDARRKCWVCVRVFKEENNGHYYCVTHAVGQKMAMLILSAVVGGKKGDPDV